MVLDEAERRTAFVEALQRRYGPTFGMIPEGRQRAKARSPEVIRRGARIRLIRLKREWAQRPPRLSSTLLDKLRREGAIAWPIDRAA